ncbi:(d)CMP kinase [uncultured Dubosiella sp.]|uniref:(d)CMP kinase n=2 Tax=uncultured Dubosiella sp. TaxID=1937011 RepID=UPI002731030D|nr:(d)CMP kinase [uncultured Dubosiella sp.]
MAQLSRTKKYQEFRDKLDEETTAAQSQPVKPRLSRVQNHQLSHASRPMHVHEDPKARQSAKSDFRTSPVMDELLGEVKQYNIDNGTRITDDTQINILRQLDTPAETKKRTRHFLPMEEDEDEGGSTMKLPKSISGESALSSLMPNQKLTRINPVAIKETEISQEEVNRMIEQAKAEEKKEIEKIVLSSNDIRADEKADTDRLDVLMTRKEEIDFEEEPVRPRKKKKKKKTAASKPKREETKVVVKEDVEMPSAKMRMRAEDYDNDLSEKKSKKSGMWLNIALIVLINIAIDGPSGVGKSSISNRLAEHNHMTHLDTGAMYRCVALAIRQNDVDLDDEMALQRLLDTIRISFDGPVVYLNGNDVTEAIKVNEISNFTSKIATIPMVRERMVALQQKATEQKNFIVDGRDIGTTVLPDAEVKIFLSASPKARAERRYNEYVEKGIESDYETIYQDIVARDYQDTHRKVSPLRKADDAIEVDTSDLTIDEVEEVVQDIIDKAL